MANISGREISFGVAVEDVRGTGPAAADRWLRKVTANVVERAEKVNDDTTTGQLEDAIGSRVVRKWIEGEVAGIVHADVLGYLLYNLYGTVVADAIGGGRYEHLFSLEQSVQHPSLALYAKDGDLQQAVFENGMVNTLEITAVHDNYVRFTVNFMARNKESNGDAPDFTNDEFDFIGRDVTVKVANNLAGLGAAPAIKVRELTVRWDQGLTPDNVLGSYFPADFYNQKHMIEFEITRDMEDTTFKDLFLGDEYRAVEINIAGDEVGAGNPRITLTMPRVSVIDWNRSGGNDEIVNEPVSFKAFRDSTDGMSTCTVVNETVEYDVAES